MISKIGACQSSLCSNRLKRKKEEKKENKKKKRAKKHLVYVGYLPSFLAPRKKNFLFRHLKSFFDQQRARSRISQSQHTKHHQYMPTKPQQAKASDMKRPSNRRNSLSLSFFHHSPFNGKSLELAPTCMVNFPLVGITQFPLPVLQ